MKSPNYQTAFHLGFLKSPTLNKKATISSWNAFWRPILYQRSPGMIVHQLFVYIYILFVYIFCLFFLIRYRKDKVIKEDSRITWECKKGKKNRFLLTLRYVVPETEFKIALEGNGLKKLYFISSYCLIIQFWELDPSLNHSGKDGKNTVIKWGYES